MAEISFTISAAPGITNNLIAVIYKTTSPAAEVDRIVDSSDHSSPTNFQFNDLANGVYIVKIHESADGTTLGNLRHDFWIDAETNQILVERRFYEVAAQAITTRQMARQPSLTLTSQARQCSAFIRKDSDRSGIP